MLQSEIGDSIGKRNVTTANRTWGNLIDLTDEGYGLQAITLWPAIFYNVKNNLWTMTHSSWASLCNSTQAVLMAYCSDACGLRYQR